MLILIHHNLVQPSVTIIINRLTSVSTNPTFECMWAKGLECTPMYAKELPRTPAHSPANGVHAREYIDVQECTPGSTLMSRSARQGVHRRPGVHAREYIDVQECTPGSTLTSRSARQGVHRRPGVHAPSGVHWSTMCVHRRAWACTPTPKALYTQMSGWCIP